jgi:hypothetical protein
MTPEEVAASYAEAGEAGEWGLNDAEFDVPDDDEHDDLDDDDGSGDKDNLDANDGPDEAGGVL